MTQKTCLKELQLYVSRRPIALALFELPNTPTSSSLSSHRSSDTAKVTPKPENLTMEPGRSQSTPHTAMPLLLLLEYVNYLSPRLWPADLRCWCGLFKSLLPSFSYLASPGLLVSPRDHRPRSWLYKAHFLLLLHLSYTILPFYL
jgi:hypothetical protein